MQRAELTQPLTRTVQYNKRYQQNVSYLTTKYLPFSSSRFMNRLLAILESNYADSDFNVKHLSETLSMSERQLQRKIKDEVDTTPSTFLRRFRLEKALAQLNSGRAITEIALDSGFSSPAYFSYCFKYHFGTTPTKMIA